MARHADDKQTAHLWIEEGETRTAPLVTVAPAAPVDKTYTFTASEEMAAELRVGQRVVVPFGRKGREAPAFVIGIDRGPWSSTLKAVVKIADPAGYLSDDLLALGKWVARYYCCPLGRTLAAMIPQAVRRQRGFATVRHASLAAPLETIESARLGEKQRLILEALQAAARPVEVAALLQATGASRSTLRGLLTKGWVTEIVTKEPPPEGPDLGGRGEPSFDLNADQQAAVLQVEEVLRGGEFRALVVYGVSGSGKTEVYVRAMRQVLAVGKQAIMLVPEIALTTQLMRRLTARFDRVAVIHSGLTGAERSLAWDAIRTGRTPVVIGTRSAVFAPCPNLGLLVVDEEQEPSYKNLQSPRFHVRDVAIKRAHQLGIPIILGSATPSLETWHNQQTLPTYERVDLPHRVRSLPMPEVRLVDTRDQPVFGGGSISFPLMKELENTLARREQAVVLLNRRGYATWLYCPACKQQVRCPNCHSSLVLHRDRDKLLCHHCQGTTDVPAFCADLSCQTRLVQGGGGTERIEQQLREYFPNARIRRADSDTMTHARDYHQLVQGFEDGAIDILVGTQMIAKGLDFPNVSLVGVVGADPGGAAADFRAAERLFQLVTQVAGRAGRADVPGRVIVQSSATDMPALRFAMNHDFEGLAHAELPMRRQQGFPPYCRLTRFVLAGKRDKQTTDEAGALAERLRQTIATCGSGGGDVLGPQPCVIERIRNMYRHEVLLRAPSAGRMLAILDSARQSGALRARATTMIVDVDPVSLG